MRITLLLLSLCFFSSCASLLNTRRTAFQVVSSRNTTVTVDTTTNIVPPKKGALFITERKAGPVKVALKNDSMEKEIIVRPIISYTVYFNALNLGLGLLKDKKTVKRFTYPKIWVNMQDEGNTYYTAKPATKGLVSVNFAYPIAHQFYFRQGKLWQAAEMAASGIGIGLNYWYDPFKYFSVQTGIMGVNIILNSPGKWSQTFRHFQGKQINIRHNHVMRKFDFGYGLAVTQYRMEKFLLFMNGAETERIYQFQYADYGLGLSSSAHLRLTPMLVVGLIYQPRFISFSRGIHFNYEHNFSLDFLVRVPFRKSYIRN